MSILVLGLGNALMTDDAFGVRAVAELQRRYIFAEEAAAIDGGTLGLDLLPWFEGVTKLLILDALQMDAEPGTVFRLEGEDVPRAMAGKLSVHQMGLQDLLAVAELQGDLPAHMVVWGVQAGKVEMGLELTAEVARAMEEVLTGAMEELRRWGVPPSARLRVDR